MRSLTKEEDLETIVRYLTRHEDHETIARSLTKQEELEALRFLTICEDHCMVLNKIGGLWRSL